MRDVPASDIVTEVHSNRIILGSSKGHLNLVFLKPKRSGCDATIGKVLADRLAIADEQQVTDYVNQFTGKRGSNNLIRIRIKVSFFNSSGKLIASSVSPQTVVDNGSKKIGCMDMYDAWPRRSCSLGGRKVIMVSEYELADDVEPKFEVFDSAGNQRPSVEEFLVQPVNTPTTMTVTNTTIIFLTPAQPNLRRIRESIGEFSLKLVARRRSDGLTSRKFNFHYVEHNEMCDHSVDSQDEVARIEESSDVGSVKDSMNKSADESELVGDSSSALQHLPIKRTSVPPCPSPVLLGKRFKPSENSPPILPTTLLEEKVNWTMEPLDSKDNLASIINIRLEANKDTTGKEQGPKIFLPPPDNKGCFDDRRLVIDS